MASCIELKRVGDDWCVYRDGTLVLNTESRQVAEGTVVELCTVKAVDVDEYCRMVANVGDLVVVRDKGNIVATVFVDSKESFMIHPQIANARLTNAVKGSIYVGNRDVPCHYLDIELKNNPNSVLEELVGKRFNTLKDIKKAIAEITGAFVGEIWESTSDRPKGIDFMIDFEVDEDDVHTIIKSIYYLKDNAGQYYITEV